MLENRRFPALAQPTAGLKAHSLNLTNLNFLCICLVIGLGIGLRFANLSGKPFWIDEAFSLFHVSGFSEAFVRQQLIATKPISVAELMQYQFPHAQNSLMGTIYNIAKTAPELPPLYFILLNLWMTIFGKSILAIRSLSAILSLFCFPALYWLCWELFQVSIVGWCAMALFALSPFNFIMAQEARPYSLWTICFLVSGAALLRAQRTNCNRDWGIHTISMVMGFYTHLFSLLLWLIYAIYMAVTERLRWTHSLYKYAISSVLLGLATAPWLWIGFGTPRDPNYQPFATPHPSILSLIKGLYRGIGLFFIDFNLNESSPKGLFVSYFGLMGLILLLLGYSFWYLFRRSPRRANAFLGIIVFLPIVLFAMTDLVLGANRVTMTRYFIPGGIGMLIVVAYTIAAKQTLRFQSSQPENYWQKRFYALLLVGFFSCSGFLLSPNWWHKDQTRENTCIISQTDNLAHPLLVTDAYYVRAMALGHELKPTVRFLFMPSQSIYAPQLPLEQTFLYLPSPNFKKAMEQRYQLQNVCHTSLWQVMSLRQR